MSPFLIATHALVFLAHKGQRQNSQALADNICANPAEVRRVMGLLVDAGLATAKGGRSGGYLLAKPAEKTKLSDVAIATHTHFLSGLWKTGDIEQECAISSGMGPWAESEQFLLELKLHEFLATQTIAQVEAQLLTHDSEQA